MILRSVTKHVKEQNWFAVILDLVIVVFGVFIGIQVSNWNEELARKEETTVLINRLLEDLAREQEVIAINMDYISIVKKYGITTLRGFNNADLVNDEQFVIAAYQASQISGLWSFRSAYAELIRTGNINFIKEKKLKDLILGYYSSDLNNQNVVNATYREYIRGVIPYEIQDAIRSECGDKSVPVAHTYGNILPETCDLMLSDELFHETAAYLRSQSDMLKHIQYQLAVYESNIYTYVNFNKDLQKLMKMIVEYQQ